MKKILIVLAGLILVLLAVAVFRFKGTLPAVLPPQPILKTSSPQSKEAVNETGLTISKDFSIKIFARDLTAPRDVEVDDKGTVIASIPSKGKVVALPDKNNDGKADTVVDLVSGLDRPHGLAFHNGKLYIAEVTKIVAYDYDSDNLKIKNPQKITDLPSSGRHFTRTIVFGNDDKLYISVGSTCDVCVEKDERNGTILVYDPQTHATKIFAKGLRNSVFLTISPDNGEIYATEMGRDFLGDNLPPEEINIIRENKNYGWPYCFDNKIVDSKFNPQTGKNVCPGTEAPFFEMCAHCAPLGIAFIKSTKFPKDWDNDILVSFHGSWNSTKPVGYKIVHLVLKDNKVVKQEDFISGFLDGVSTKGRPVDLKFAKDGSLYVSDDKAGVIYKVEAVKN